MRTIGIITLCIMVLVISLAGCGTASKEIQTKSQSERTDVFVEIKPGTPIHEGFAELLITVNIKTPCAGYCILESEQSFHGKPAYSFLMNIDGQAALWKAEGTRDIKPVYDKDGKTSHDPEAGEGLKYVLEKRLKLRAGQHRIFFSLPEENYSATTNIVLKSGEKAILEYKPIYRYKTFPTRIPTFLEGISKYEVFLNGKQL